MSALRPEQLYRKCDPASFAFNTTDELKDLEELPSQERALQAIRFGTKIKQRGYNLFVLGPAGTGKHSTVTKLLTEAAAADDTPCDWVYLYNFATPHKPKAMALPPGRGISLQQKVQSLIDDIQTSVPAAFESDDYRNRRQALDEAAHEKQSGAFTRLREKAEEKSIALIRTPMGFALAPVKNGAVVETDEFAKLPEDEQKRIQSEISELEDELEAIVKQIPAWAKEHQDAVRALKREVTALTIGHPIDELIKVVSDLPEVVDHLEKVRADLVENIHTILSIQQSSEQQKLDNGSLAVSNPNAFSRYAVNLIVGQEAGKGAPVVYEDNPTMPNLVGRVEHAALMGTLVTDFTLIQPGALHMANGGYLILDARKVLLQPFAWESLKRNLKAGHINIESPGQMLSLISTVSLEPEDIPLSIKVVLCGDPYIYYLLNAYDPEFATLFKVAADFDDIMPRDDDGHQVYARLLATMVRREKLRPLDRSGVARVIEHGSRLADDAERLSIQLETLVDLLREADFFSDQEGGRVVAEAHVQQAIDARIFRADRLRQRSHESIQRGIVLLDTSGAVVGQVNGLSVLQLGSFAFGRPSRITAQVRVGMGKVVDIEREVELGGPLHSKGVLILSGFLSSRYALNVPFSLAASLVFEQSYGGIEGDSASSAELYALLSALAQIPLKQSLAVTGSVNQHGQIQAIGGVNEKIEGFFDVCSLRGLTGEQGVLIPQSNVKHLMLRSDVVEAVAAGQFNIYPVSTIDEGLELLTGVPAGVCGQDGIFPENSVNRGVEDRLVGFARSRQNFAREGDTRQDGNDNGGAATGSGQ